MADAFAYGDDDADTDEHAAAFPRLNRRQRVAEEPQEPPVDPALLAWARNEKQLVEDAARVRAIMSSPHRRGRP